MHRSSLRPKAKLDTARKQRLALLLLVMVGAGLLIGSVGRARVHAKAAPTAGFPLNPNDFISLGPSPFSTAGTYTIDASKNNVAPTLSGPGIVTHIAGVFHSPSMGATANDEIAVFTFDSIAIPAGVTVAGARNANSRPIALLSKGSVTVAGSVDVSGDRGGDISSTLNTGGAGGAAGPGGGGGGGGGMGIGQAARPPRPPIPSGPPGPGGPGFVNGRTGTFQGTGAGGSVSANGGGGLSAGGAFGGNGGANGGTAYGDLTLRLQGGSGGGGGTHSSIAGDGGGGGGGGLEIGAITVITIKGSIQADGGAAAHFAVSPGGGGAGGAILLHATTIDFSGSGRLSAVGGFAPFGGGGGGRIHIAATDTINEGCVVVAGGGNGSGGVYSKDAPSVVPPDAVKLSFGQQPTNTMPNTVVTPPVTVRILDQCGNLVQGSTATVTLGLANNPSAANLGGVTSVAAVAGVATFSNLSIDKPGTGYTLAASSTDLTGDTSNAFSIVCPAITATVSGGATLCPGASATVTVTLSGGSAPWTVMLSDGKMQTDSNATFNFTVSPAATTIYTALAIDAKGCPAIPIDSATISIEDTQPPTLTLTNNLVLWPPDHSYRTVTVAQMVATVSDNCSTLSVSDVVIEKVTSDEPDNAPGTSDGNTVNDILIAVDCRSVQLRSERDDQKNGRVYVITLRVKDGSGNATRKDFKVSVPIGMNGVAARQDAAALTILSSCP